MGLDHVNGRGSEGSIMEGDMKDLEDAEVGLISEQIKSTGIELPRKQIAACSTVAMILLFLAGALVIMFTVIPMDETPSLNASSNSTKSSFVSPVNLLVVGDWGRQGQYNQSIIAEQMGRLGGELDVKFIISTGDNFYETGLTGVDDDLFEKSFSLIYTAPSLQKSWYAVLGNHDYRGDPEVQVNNRLGLRDSRWHCEYTYTLPVDLSHSCSGKSESWVEFFFIDTNPFEESYWVDDNLKYNWTRPTSREDVIARQLKDLTAALEASTADWKVVVGHHPVYSYGVHGNTEELIEKVLPILEANTIDLYINGHDHDLQHIKREDSDIHFVTSGGGSKAWRGDEQPANANDSELFYDGQGFISLSITTTSLEVKFYDITGTVIHRLALTKGN